MKFNPGSELNVSPIESLPIELLMNVLSRLSAADLLHLGQSTKNFHLLINNDVFWKQKLKFYYPEEYDKLTAKEAEPSKNAFYEQFKWCYEQGYSDHTTVYSKDKNTIGWKLIRRLYLRLREGDFDLAPHL